MLLTFKITFHLCSVCVFAFILSSSLRLLTSTNVIAEPSPPVTEIPCWICVSQQDESLLLRTRGQTSCQASQATPDSDLKTQRHTHLIRKMLDILRICTLPCLIMCRYAVVADRPL